MNLFVPLTALIFAFTHQIIEEMKLVADSGSTKTAWSLLDGNEEFVEFRTLGLNPYFHTVESVVKVLKEELLPKLSRNQNEITEIFFYGAGCSSERDCELIKSGIKQVFTDSLIHVEHDLLGAARALCGDSPGVAGILGTGSNSCFYDGIDVVANIPALSYILGDEGSGAHMGKQIVKDFLYEEMPSNLREKFQFDFDLTKDKIFEAVYKQPLPNRFLASLSKFVSSCIDEPYAQELVKNSFREFFDHHVLKYSNYGKNPLHLVGSIALIFEKQLVEVASEKGIEIGKIIRTPIEHLAKYHQN